MARVAVNFVSYNLRARFTLIPNTLYTIYSSFQSTQFFLERAGISGCGISQNVELVTRIQIDPHYF